MLRRFLAFCEGMYLEPEWSYCFSCVDFFSFFSRTHSCCLAAFIISSYQVFSHFYINEESVIKEYFQNKRHGQLNKNGAPTKYSIIRDLYRKWKPTNDTMNRVQVFTISNAISGLLVIPFGLSQIQQQREVNCNYKRSPKL